jgi:prevent-host-death family protein
MDEVPVTKARADLADLVNRVVYGGERIVLTRHGRAVAAIVSADDLRRLEQEATTAAGAQVTVVDSSLAGPGTVLAPAAAWDAPGPGQHPGSRQPPRM